MSYAIAPTFEGNRMGIRRLSALSGIGGVPQGLGDALGDQYAAALVQAGADPALVSTVQAMGATNDQLAAVYDGTIDLPTLLQRLTGTLSPSNPASPANPIPTTVSTAFGVYDLAQQSSWNAINSLFTNTQQKLTALARQSPSDPNVVSLVSQFNSLVQQWAGYYYQAFGSNPSPMPTVTLSGLGFAPLVVVVGLAAGVVVFLATLYTINQAIDAYKASITVRSTALSQAQAAVAAGNPGLANQILSTAGIQSSGAGTPTDWVKTNWPILLAGGLGFLVLGVVFEKRV